jgi:hypothetical protein
VQALCIARSFSTPQAILDAGNKDGLSMQCSLFSFPSGRGDHADDRSTESEYILIPNLALMESYPVR